MNQKIYKILITGGSGFIGSNLILYLIKNKNLQILNIDKLAYSGNTFSLSKIAQDQNYNFLNLDICNKKGVQDAFANFQPDLVINLAAESHVDRSISNPNQFIKTNINGVYNLLEVSNSYWNKLKSQKKDNFKFLHISTDEVFGDIGHEGIPADEKSQYNPSSPYAASKACSDHLVLSWFKTYGLPTIVSNCSNNYGPYQYPEKLIPHVILRAIQKKSIPIYGKGDQIRNWLHVNDHINAIEKIIFNANPGETYVIGGKSEKKNLNLVGDICDILNIYGKKYLENPSRNYHDYIEFVEDRPGHDFRYSLNFKKITKELNWNPKISFEIGLKDTVIWYLNNLNWINNILAQGYTSKRIGVFK